jgi:secreted trypsin-like serine protease
MKKIWFALVATLALALGAAAPSGAVTNGTLDGNGHPYVGLMVAKDASGTPLWRCSGTLISPQRFLTAGHCTEDPAARVEIWFATDVDSGRPANGYPNTGEVSGVPHTHPLFDTNAFFLHDVGVVTLNTPVTMTNYGTLPTVNQLDALKPSRATTFTAVGYGLQRAFPDAAAFLEQAQRVRMVASPHLLQINTGFTGPQSLLLSNNANTGGTCFGDSGGPNFVGTSRVVAAVTSFGLNSTCGGTGGVFRVDRQNVLDFVNSFPN